MGTQYKTPQQNRPRHTIDDTHSSKKKLCYSFALA